MHRTFDHTKVGIHLALREAGIGMGADRRKSIELAFGARDRDLGISDHIFTYRSLRDLIRIAYYNIVGHLYSSSHVHKKIWSWNAAGRPTPVSPCPHLRRNGADGV